MLTGRLTRGLDEKRLKVLLAAFFIALALPTAVLIWQGFSQLKWESFHQHRVLAEALTNRIDAELGQMIIEADRQSFADYGFLIVTGDPDANFVQRSPLSVFPVEADIPGVLGYFQVGVDGEFSTPILPAAGADYSTLGISNDEMKSRSNLAEEIRIILAENELIRSRPAAMASRARLTSEQESRSKESVNPAASVSSPPARTLVETSEKDLEDRDDLGIEETIVQESAADSPAPVNEVLRNEAPVDLGSTLQEPESDIPYSQDRFQQLNQSALPAEFSAVASGGMADVDAVTTEAELRDNSLAKVSDIKLDDDLQQRSLSAEKDEEIALTGVRGRTPEPARQKRREQSAVLEPALPAEQTTNLNESTVDELRIDTFESEVDPFEFSMLDSGHFVFFRDVWRNGERFVQGLLIDQEQFVRRTVGDKFLGSAIANMSNLIIAFQGNVILTVTGRDAYGVSSRSADLNGTLLSRRSLSAPLDRFELIFSVAQLPTGPGASVLGWVTFVLAIVFVGGFVILYRLGQSQIHLSRQQQDFVSAVSHELKTPLTSIRMYGEMLKEGWADETKRQDYYEYIHDESERLARMISNVLQLANITNNEPYFDLKPASVGELMSNIESKISTQVERAGYTLALKRSTGQDAQNLHIDEDCFTQIIINLVDNALKFSKDATNKTIEIGSSTTQSGRIEFSVRDFGPGIPKDQMKKIFKLFYRSESELTRETVGTGIGLAIVHQLTTAMDGTVDVQNRNPGAEFVVSFPAS